MSIADFLLSTSESLSFFIFVFLTELKIPCKLWLADVALKRLDPSFFYDRLNEMISHPATPPISCPNRVRVVAQSGQIQPD
jgi:hypothetical protein